MYKGEIYLSVQDLMQLMGTGRYNTGKNEHKTIRESIQPGKKNLTILEYCNYSGEDYLLIFHELRGKAPGYIPPTNSHNK